MIGAEHGRTALRCFEIANHLAGREVVHRARQIAMPAERHHERDAIADRLAARRDNRQAAGEADPEDADLAVGPELRLLAGPLHRVLDHVGDLRRHLESLEIGCGHGQHAESSRGKILGESDQPRFVDAVAVHTGHQQDGAPRLPAGAIIAARHLAAARWHGDIRIARDGGGPPGCERRRGPGQIGGANDEAECVEIGERGDAAKMSRASVTSRLALRFDSTGEYRFTRVQTRFRTKFRRGSRTHRAEPSSEPRVNLVKKLRDCDRWPFGGG